MRTFKFYVLVFILGLALLCILDGYLGLGVGLIIAAGLIAVSW